MPVKNSKLQSRKCGCRVAGPIFALRFLSFSLFHSLSLSFLTARPGPLWGLPSKRKAQARASLPFFPHLSAARLLLLSGRNVRELSEKQMMDNKDDW